MSDEERPDAVQLSVAMMRLGNEHPSEVYTAEGYAIWLRSTAEDIVNASSLAARLATSEAERERLTKIEAAAKLMSASLVELSLACEVYFDDPEQRLPDADDIEAALVHAYRDQNNFRDALAASPVSDTQPADDEDRSWRPVDRIPSHQSPPADGTCYVTVNRKPYKVKADDYLPREIREWCNVPDDYDLWLIKPGHNDVKVEGRIYITTSGLRFFSTPKFINASAPVSDTDRQGDTERDSEGSGEG